MKERHIRWLLVLLMVGGVAHAGVDQWDFSSDLSASMGSGTLAADAGTITYETAVINGRTADVASFTNGTGYTTGPLAEPGTLVFLTVRPLRGTLLMVR